MKTNFNYPAKSAKGLAIKMRQFRAKTENTAYSELNPNADSDRVEVVRNIDWAAFDTIINQLEFVYNSKKSK